MDGIIIYAINLNLFGYLIYDMPKTRKNTKTRKLLRKIREANMATTRYTPIPKAYSGKYPIYNQLYFPSKINRKTRMRGGNGSGTPTELVVPFVDKGDALQHTYSRLLAGNMQAVEYGKV